MQAELLTEATREPWDAFVRAHRHGSWWHTSYWLDYQLAYTGGRGASTLLRRDREVVGVSPLIVVGDRAEMGGMPLPVTLWADGSSAPPDALRDGLRGGRFMGPLGDAGDDRSVIWRTRVLDLDDGLARLWRGVRKSYHALVHQGERRYWIQVGTSARLAEDYERVHRAAGGRLGGEQTYGFQRAWLQEGFGFVACAYYPRDGALKPVAATYVLVYKDWAYYASGPSLLPNVQHALQWAVIRHLVARGDIRHYELGWQGEARSEKGQHIEFFKRGWGGRDVVFPVWEVASDGST